MCHRRTAHFAQAGLNNNCFRPKPSATVSRSGNLPVPAKLSSNCFRRPISRAAPFAIVSHGKKEGQCMSRIALRRLRRHLNLRKSPARRRSGPFRQHAAEVLEARQMLAATLWVDAASTKAGDFHTIQAAVNAANNGDTIKVAPGVYTESVTVPKSVTISGGLPHSPARLALRSSKVIRRPLHSRPVVRRSRDSRSPRRSRRRQWRGRRNLDGRNAVRRHGSEQHHRGRIVGVALNSLTMGTC